MRIISKIWESGRERLDQSQSFATAQGADFSNNANASPSRMQYGSFSRFNERKFHQDSGAAHNWRNEGYNVRDQRSFNNSNMGHPY